MAKITLIVLFFLALARLTQGCPKIISRAKWAARATKIATLTTFPPTHVVIHHSSTKGCTTQAQCIKLVKSFQNTHMDKNGWSDIGYNFLIGGDGQIYEGRGWGKTGAHAINFNSRSIGICFIGTFTSTNPPASAIRAAQALISCGVSRGEIKRKYKLIGHRQTKETNCPGDTLFKTIRKWPNWVKSP